MIKLFLFFLGISIWVTEPLYAQDAPVIPQAPEATIAVPTIVDSPVTSEIPNTGEAAVVQTPPENIESGVVLIDTATPTLENYQSIMFNKTEYGQIEEVIKAIKNNQPLPNEVEADLTQAMPPPAAEVAYTYPQFHLASIAYYKPGDWVIWINNQKITPENAHIVKGLTVLSVEPSQVVLEYVFEPTDRSNFNNKPADERITLDPYNRKATFLLHPNQTFSSYNWKIYEGKVQQMVEQGVAKSKPLLDLPAVDEVFSNPLPEKTVPAKQTGIQGLLNQYEKIDNKNTP